MIQRKPRKGDAIEYRFPGEQRWQYIGRVVRVNDNGSVRVSMPDNQDWLFIWRFSDGEFNTCHRIREKEKRHEPKRTPRRHR